MPRADKSARITLPFASPSLKHLRHIILVLFFLGLAALEVAHGVFRINAIRENQHRDTLLAIQGGHGELAREVRGRLEEAREHAAYVGRLPAVSRLLAADSSDEEQRKSLEGEILPYVVSFRRIDRVRVLDARGKERFRCERIGKGVGALPEALLDREPDAAMVELTRGARPFDVVLSPLVSDSRRVEVPPSDRQVLHFAASLGGGQSQTGVLVLTVYATPILNQVRRFAPIPGVFSMLVSGDGTYLASPDRSRELYADSPRNLREDYPDAAPSLLSGSQRVRTKNALFLSLPAGDIRSPWSLITCIPDSALELASSRLRGEYAWVAGAMVVTTLLLIFAGAFFVKMSLRELKLREAARYEKQEKELERQVQRSERLGSLGLLTAGVAHEINNPLEGIENYLALLEKDSASPEKRKRYLEMIRYGFRRIRDIVRDLSSFARPGVSEGSANLKNTVEQALKMVEYTKEFKEVRVEKRGLDPPLVVPGDQRRLEQVFINLFLNAAKAMRGQGRLFIEARKVSQGSPQVEVLVEDEGPGIPEEILGRIFDPFFTATEGTGLGLSISYGIVRAHGGTIRAENRSGGGARFILTLPAEEPVLLAGGPLSGGPRRG